MKELRITVPSGGVFEIHFKKHPALYERIAFNTFRYKGNSPYTIVGDLISSFNPNCFNFFTFDRYLFLYIVTE